MTSRTQSVQTSSGTERARAGGDPGQPPSQPLSHLGRLPSGSFGYEEARHLLWRAGFGGTPSQIQALVSMGVERAVDHIVDYERIPYERPQAEDFDPEIMRPPSEEERRRYRTALQNQDEDVVARFRMRRQEQQRADRAQVREMRRWWLARMVESPRPLEEKMTLFWHGHFATGYRKIENSYHAYMQNQFFRANATGNFGRLLRGIIRDPAMLAYLDNQRSNRRRPNENLARELMELFSLGVGNYTENDIKEGARALTGYSFEHNEFVFDEQAHDRGTKRILGRRGALDGDGFVDAILARRACAEFIAARLYSFFVADLPADVREIDRETRSFVGRLATVIAQSNYELKPALKRLFRSDHFYHARFRNDKIKSPAELVVGAVRSLLTPARDLNLVADAMGMMGQELFQPPSVRGWPGGRTWINTSTLFVRQNALAYLLTGVPAGRGQRDRTPFDATGVLAELERAEPGASNDPERLAPYLLRATLGRRTPEAERIVASFIRENGGRPTNDMLTGVLLLATAMPEYQLC